MLFRSDRFRIELNPTVAVIGLGRMGTGMAQNIQKAGFPLIVYNRTVSKTEPFVAAGARAVDTPREAAEADIILTSLLDDSSVIDMLVADNGILAGLSTDSIQDRKSTRLNSSHTDISRMPSSA